jgi:hypothetical protein
MEADEAMRDALDAGSTPGEGSTAHRKEGWRRHRAESTQIVVPSTDDAKAEGKVPRCAARAGTGSDLASPGYCGDQQGRVSAGREAARDGDDGAGTERREDEDPPSDKMRGTGWRKTLKMEHERRATRDRWLRWVDSGIEYYSIPRVHNINTLYIYI